MKYVKPHLSSRRLAVSSFKECFHDALKREKSRKGRQLLQHQQRAMKSHLHYQYTLVYNVTKDVHGGPLDTRRNWIPNVSSSANTSV